MQERVTADIFGVQISCQDGQGRGQSTSGNSTQLPVTMDEFNVQLSCNDGQRCRVGHSRLVGLRRVVHIPRHNFTSKSSSRIRARCSLGDTLRGRAAINKRISPMNIAVANTVLLHP